MPQGKPRSRPPLLLRRRFNGTPVVSHDPPAPPVRRQGPRHPTGFRCPPGPLSSRPAEQQPAHETPEDTPNAGHEEEREQPRPESGDVYQGSNYKQGDGRADGGPHPSGKSDRPVAPGAQT